MLRSLLPACALAALTSCAVQPPAARPAPAAVTAKPAPAAANTTASAQPTLAQPKVICVNEAPLGSHLTERVCRPVDDSVTSQQRREMMQNEMARPRSFNNGGN